MPANEAGVDADSALSSSAVSAGGALVISRSILRVESESGSNNY